MTTLFKKSKIAIVSAIAVTGTILMVTSIKDLLPTYLSTTYMFIIGLALVLLSGYLSYVFIKTR